MTDLERRLASLRGMVDAPRFVDGEAESVTAPLADLLAKPDGARDRQLVQNIVADKLDAERRFRTG